MAIVKSTGRRTRVTTNAPPKNNRQSSPSSGLRNRSESDSDQSKDYTVISDTSSEGPELELEVDDEAGELQELDTWLKNGAPGELSFLRIFAYFLPYGEIGRSGKGREGESV